MFGGFAQIRPDERRRAFAAFATLLAFMAGYAMLETARDALFLGRIAASRLPWVYLAIAAASLTIALFAEGRGSRRAGYGLAAWLLASAVTVLGFTIVVPRAGRWALYMLYIWSGVISTIVLTRFWLLLGEQFTLTQAKRLYGPVGVGSVLGAIIGSAIARLMTSIAPLEQLLAASALLLVASAAGPLFMESSSPARAKQPPAPALLNPKLLFESAYALRLASLVLSSTVAFILVDYIFKSTAAALVPPQELGKFFASVYLALNLLSLVAQLVLVQPLIRGMGVSAALAVLPIALIGGAAGILLSGGLLAALLLKGADGALRYSLHRTVLELLFIPMGERLRASAKTLIDVVGQRGGQALGSVLILGAVALGARLGFYAATLIALALLWVFTAYELRKHYMNLFRQTLRESAGHPRVRFPELDLTSLESVIAALNSTNDAVVRTALHILADEGRARLIPALILYHPSPEVVVDALEVLERSGRTDFYPITERLLDNAVPEVRAAVLRMRNTRSPDEALLRRAVLSDSSLVRATALISLVRAGLATEQDRQLIDELLDSDDIRAKIGLAQAIAHKPGAAFEDIVIRLAQGPDIEQQRAALQAMTAAPSARYLHTLMRMLTWRELRAEARAALVGLQDTALSFLGGALADEERPAALRRHLPRTIMRFAPERAARILLEQLPVEKDGVARYKILRALTQMRGDNPKLYLDPQVLRRAIEATISRTYQLLEWRITLKLGAAADERRKTEAQELLVRLLGDKEVHAVQRLFLLLGLELPDEDVAALFRGISSTLATVRSSSRELLENLLEAPLRDAVLGLIDDAPNEQRLAQAGIYHRPTGAHYDAVLRALLDTPSQALQSLALYHAAELGLSSLNSRIEAMAQSADGLLASVARAAVELLSRQGRLELALED